MSVEGSKERPTYVIVYSVSLLSLSVPGPYQALQNSQHTPLMPRQTATLPLALTLPKLLISTTNVDQCELQQFGLAFSDIMTLHHQFLALGMGLMSDRCASLTMYGSVPRDDKASQATGHRL